MYVHMCIIITDVMNISKWELFFPIIKKGDRCDLSWTFMNVVIWRKIYLANAVYKERVAFVFIKSSWGLERTFPYQKLFYDYVILLYVCIVWTKHQILSRKHFKLYGWHFVFSGISFSVKSISRNFFHEIDFTELISWNYHGKKQ